MSQTPSSEVAHPTAGSIDVFEACCLHATDGLELPYRLFKPADTTRALPLVLFLHGAGERGSDNAAQLIHGVGVFARSRDQGKYPCYVVAPQCPSDCRWVEVDWGADAHEQPAAPSRPLAAVLELLADLRRRLNVDARRIYVTGISMGGYGTWDVVARHPSLFAAAVPVCGGADERTAHRVSHLPIWAFHSADDGAVKVCRSRNMIQALRSAGGRPRYTEYTNLGHNCWDTAYREPELLKWLFAQHH
jgi:predicted peptidase